MMLQNVRNIILKYSFTERLQIYFILYRILSGIICSIYALSGSEASPRIIFAPPTTIVRKKDFVITWMLAPQSAFYFIIPLPIIFDNKQLT